jgi:dynein heavy chain, axonemal
MRVLGLVPRMLLQLMLDTLPRTSMQESERKTIVALCQHIHQEVQVASENFYTELRRRNYVTPTSFLELIQMFQKVLASKRARNRQLRTR